MNRRNFLRGTVSVMALAAVLKFSQPTTSGVSQSPPRAAGGPFNYKGPVFIGGQPEEYFIRMDTFKYAVTFK